MWRPPIWYQLLLHPLIVKTCVETQPLPSKLQVLPADPCVQPAANTRLVFADCKLVCARLLDQTQAPVVQLTRCHLGLLAHEELEVQLALQPSPSTLLPSSQDSTPA